MSFITNLATSLVKGSKIAFNSISSVQDMV